MISNTDLSIAHDNIRQGSTATAEARRLGVPRTTFREAMERWIQGRGFGDRMARNTDSLVFDYPVPVFNPSKLSPAKVIDPSRERLLRVVHFTDTHVEFHDERVLEIVFRIIERVQPNMVIHGGDLLDCYKLSRFDKNPFTDISLKGEVTAARDILWTVRDLVPTARMILLEGNHEDRLRKLLWNMAPEANALMELTNMQEQATWPKILDLESLQVEFIPYREQTKHDLLPKMIVKHGTIVRKWSGWSAKGEHEKYGKGGVSGHTHRLGGFWHRDHNGNHVWWEAGCTCSLDPDWMADPDWQQGCLVMTFDQETGAYQIEPVYIHNGSTVFREEVIVA